MMGKIFPRHEEDKALVGKMSPLWSSTLLEGVRFFTDDTGLTVDNALMLGKDPRLDEAIAARTFQGLKVNDTTEADLRDIFSTGFDEGASTAEIGDKIAEYYANNCVGAESARAQNAAMTQTTGLVNDGRMIAARDVGDLEKYWIHGNPKEPRESHIAAAQRYDEANAIPLDKPFVVDGEEMDAPGDSSASPANVCFCTCGVGFRKKG
jgi:hypothetical protein